ncbi:DNA-binding domain-containing protein [Povalibacter sp.]|uniref:DNA-binding domain-containing protein n=1 Tax=Povalibacter sp. TaxID=1962978 RepID=UPI002F408594
MDLAQLQRAFQRHVLAGDETIAAVIHASAAVPVATRLAVYAGAYRLRLAEALAHNYPRLQQLLGSEAFDTVAHGYIQAHPSTVASVRWLGDQLADYFASIHPDQPILADLARWEWAIAAAFDAADVEPLTERSMNSIDPVQWAALRLQLHPSVKVLQMSTNAPAVFKALTNNAEPPPPATLPSPQSWFIWRQELTPRYRSAPDDEADALQTLASQGTFEQLCERLCDWHDADAVPTRAVILLKGWIRDEMLVRD